MNRKRFRTGRRSDQLYLFPPAVTDWLPAQHPVYAWNAVVEELDLTSLYAAYAAGRGQPSYDPRVLVQILVYGYAHGIRSSRRLDRACYDRFSPHLVDTRALILSQMEFFIDFQPVGLCPLARTSKTSLSSIQARG